MKKVPLIPSLRPEPKVLRSREDATQEKQKESPMPSLIAYNVEDPSEKPPELLALWEMVDQIDPENVIVSDKSVIVFAGVLEDDDGNPVEGRSPSDLGLTKEQIDILEPWAVYDGPKADDAKQATAVILTIYQLLELAVETGRQIERKEVTKRLVEAAVDDDADDEGDDESDDDFEDDDEDDDFDDDEDMEVIDEDEEYDEDDEDDPFGSD
jgi:hypothetical protein